MVAVAKPEPGTPILTLIDAAHAVEQGLLQSWLNDSAVITPGAHDLANITLRIAHNPEDIDATPLLAHLDGADDTLIVPVRVVWIDPRVRQRATPRLADILRGNPRRPNEGRARKLLRQDPDIARCIQGAPATLGDLRVRFAESGGDPEDRNQLAQFIAGQAGLALDIAERQMRGGRYKVPRRVAANIKRTREYREALAAISEETGTPIAELDERADEIFEELIARPRTTWQDAMANFARRVMSMGYSPELVINEARLREMRDIVRSKPTALLWTHKTHIDGFAVYSMLFENDFPVPHLLGGINMAFAGMGYAAKRSGAVFIRRSFQDDPLYKLILRRYLAYLLEKRFPVSWAFEGTRSRVGKLMPPRYGILKYVLEAAQTIEGRDLHVIPIALNYDLIRDVKDYVSEQAGGVKRPESLSWFIGYIRGLRKPLGKIYVDFGEPIVLKGIPADDDTLGLKKIAFQVGVESNKVTPITLTSLVTTILLGHAPRALTRMELGREMVRYLRWARDRDVPVAQDLRHDGLDSASKLADILAAHGLVTHFDEGPDQVYAIAPDQHHEASYYRNTTIHHFITKAIAELALAYAADQPEDRANALRAEARNLRDLFKFEFFYAPTLAFDAEVGRELSRYDSDWEATVNRSNDDAHALLRRFKPHVAAAALLPYIEAYRVVAGILARLPSDETIDAKECLSQALAFGKQAYLQRRISSEASIGKLLFQNAYKLFANRQLVEPGQASLKQRRSEALGELVGLANRVERLRLMLAPSDRW